MELDRVYNKACFTEAQCHVMLDMINDKNIDNDCKILYIIELIHAGNISLEKAYELMEISGISEHGRVVDAKYIDEFSRRYKYVIANEKGKEMV